MHGVPAHVGEALATSRVMHGVPAAHVGEGREWQVKSAIVEELEEAMLALREGRATAGSERRTADDEEEYVACAAAVTAALAVLRRGGSSAGPLPRPSPFFLLSISEAQLLCWSAPAPSPFFSPSPPEVWLLL